MFDNFVPSEKLLCPKCKREVENKDDSDLPYRCVLQSKALECVLNLYKQGEPIEIKTHESNFFIKDGWIEAHTVCDKCDSYVKFKLVIKNGVWTDIEEWKEK
jgi:hypothetical protein